MQEYDSISYQTILFVKRGSKLTFQKWDYKGKTRFQKKKEKNEHTYF